MKIKRLCALVLMGSGAAMAGELPTRYAHDLERFAATTDSVVNDYYSSGIIGNGLLGASVYKQPGDTLCWELGRADLYDHRSGEPYSDIYSRSRLPIGKFMLPMSGGHSSMTIDLYGARVTGTIQRPDGAPIEWTTWTPAEQNVYVIEWKGERLPEITFVPELSACPRFTYPRKYYKDAGVEHYRPNPAPTIFTRGEYTICKQPMTAGGEYTTVWTTRDVAPGRKLLIASVAYSQERTDTENEAIADIEAVRNVPLKRVEQSHREWWHRFYSRCYISVGEERYDRFFWMQLYKLGSATRSDGCPIDLMGPWYYNVTPWPAVWWNLNIQLTYSPMCVIGHSELSEPMLRMLDEQVENLKRNVPAECPYPAIAVGRTSSYDCISPVGKEHGLMLWTLYYYWEYCQYTQNEQRMREGLFPLLKLAVNYYRWLLFEGEDGYLHMPKSHSPEYADAEDCNFELALLRWGCERLVEIDRQYAIGDELLPEWERILEKLTPYPQDENGMCIGRNVPYAFSHRHYSHLLMAYPLYLINKEDAEEAALIEKSLNYWQSKAGAHQGYSLTGASSISSALGKGNDALSYLNGLFGRFLSVNTLYRESGPVIETPLSGVQSIHDMLLQSWGGKIRVFPAVPDAWQDVAYYDFRAEGAFSISASRQGGKTAFIEIKSLAGEPCVLETDIARPVFERQGEMIQPIRLGEGVWQIELEKGESCVVYPAGVKPDMVVRPVENQTNNWFGKKQ